MDRQIKDVTMYNWVEDIINKQFEENYTSKHAIHQFVHAFIAEGDTVATEEQQMSFIDDIMSCIISGDELSITTKLPDMSVAEVLSNNKGLLNVIITPCALIKIGINGDYNEFSINHKVRLSYPIFVMNELLHQHEEYDESKLCAHSQRILNMVENPSIKVLAVGDHMSPIVKDWIKQSSNFLHISLSKYKNCFYKVLSSFEAKKLARYMAQQIPLWNKFYGEFYTPKLDDSFIKEEPVFYEEILKDVKMMESSIEKDESKGIEGRPERKCIGIYGNIGRTRKDRRLNRELLKKRLRYWRIRNPEFKYELETCWYDNGMSVVLVMTNA